jgi:ATP-dependent DNA helicase DinG
MDDLVIPYPAIHASHGGIWIATADGTRPIGRGEAIRIAADTPVILLNAPLVGLRLGYPELSGLDLLELFAFLYPARFAVPTPGGLARAVDLSPPDKDEDVAAFLREAAAALLAVPAGDWPERGRGHPRSGRCSPNRRSTNAGCSRDCPNGKNRRRAPHR